MCSVYAGFQVFVTILSQENDVITTRLTCAVADFSFAGTDNQFDWCTREIKGFTDFIF